MASKNTLIGGGFQDALGNVVASGYMLFVLSQDAQVNGTTQIAAGYTVKINLDANGNIVSGQSIWPNDVLSPNGTFYNVSVFSKVGQLVWGPNAQQVLSSPSPFDVGAWIPAAVNVGLGGGGVGTVNSFSFTNANGFTGVVTNPTTIPNLTITQTSLNLPSSASLTSVQGIGSKVLSYTGVSSSGQVLATDSNGTAISSGISTGNLVQTVANNVFTAFNQFLNNVGIFNLIPATSIANQSTPILEFEGQYWNGSASIADSWHLSAVLGSGTNPTTTMTFDHTGSSGSVSVALPSLQITAATTATSATAGAATALPAAPLGYVEIVVNGTTVKIPYYSV